MNFSAEESGTGFAHKVDRERIPRLSKAGNAPSKSGPVP
jgi:hypothetical protein